MSSFQARSSLLVVVDCFYYYYYYYSSIAQSFGSEVVLDPEFLEEKLSHLWQQWPQDATRLAAIHRWLRSSMESIPPRDACIDSKVFFFTPKRNDKICRQVTYHLRSSRNSKNNPSNATTVTMPLENFTIRHSSLAFRKSEGFLGNLLQDTQLWK